MNGTEIIHAIIEGDLDDDLAGIISAARERQTTKRRADGRAMFHSLKVGAKVRLVNTRPKYLVGCTAVVVQKNQTRIAIKLDDPPEPKWAGNVTATPDMLERM